MYVVNAFEYQTKYLCSLNDWWFIYIYEVMSSNPINNNIFIYEEIYLGSELGSDSELANLFYYMCGSLGLIIKYHL